jgi:predicted phosphodiesterase
MSKQTVVDKPGTYWVTGCAHAPFHNQKMYNAVYRYISKEVNLQGIILAGDIADINSLSSHDRGKIAIPGVTLAWEYAETNRFLNEIDDLEAKKVLYLFGNHEDRYLRAMKDADVSKLGEALISPIDGLQLLERGYKVSTDWKNDHIKLGKHLDICHGEFLNVHSAKKTIDTYRKSTLYFHTHRFQIYMEGLVAGWNMGSGADFTSPVFGYATRAMKNSWVNASCLVTLDRDGFYHVEPLIWMNNQLIVNGRKY